MERAEPNPNGVPTITFLTISEKNLPLGRGGHPRILALIDFRRHAFAQDRFVDCDPTKSTLNHLLFGIPPNSFDDHADPLRRQGIDLWFSEFPAMNAKAMFFHDPEDNLLKC
ncbi:MAG: hypothetical protein VXZ82_19235 [Planctomycetota bacterium]|nr:hypothetical protein [Planctomycetota bacterium]